MSRRSTPERIEAAKRAATIERLVAAGMLRDRAVAAVAAYEAASGPPTDWEAVWIALRPS